MITVAFLPIIAVFLTLVLTGQFSSAETNENNKDEDDLEIPAFLRRQKN